MQKFYLLTTVALIFNCKCHLDDLLLFQVRPGDNIVSRTWTPSPWHLPTLITHTMKSNRSVGAPENDEKVYVCHIFIYIRGDRQRCKARRWETPRFTLPNWILPENPILGLLWPSYHNLLLLMNIGFVFLFMFLMHEFPFLKFCLSRKNTDEVCNFWK